MLYLVKPAHASTVDLGGEITGSGIFQTISGGTSSLTGKFISDLLATVTVVGGLAFLVFFFLGALRWIVAGGDKGKIAEAQASMTQGVIGLIAIIAAYFVVGIVGGVLGLDIFSPIRTLFPE